MARTATKSSSATMATTENVVATEAVEEKIGAKEVKEEKLVETEEIAIEALVPHVTYYDSKTGDTYEWDQIGDIQYLTVDTIRGMWRMYKGYFRNMWLKPLDGRVIKQFGMGKIFDKYERLMDAANYTRDNINEILDDINGTPNALKNSIINRIHVMVADGELSDIHVLRTIEKRFDIDLISLL